MNKLFYNNFTSFKFQIFLKMVIIRSTFIICLTALIAVTATLTDSFVKFELKEDDLRKNDATFENFFGTRTRKMFELQEGERKTGDKLLGEETFDTTTNYINKRKIILKSDNVIITHISFQYTSKERRRPTCSLKIVAGGVGQNFVEIEFSSESNKFWARYSLYGSEEKPESSTITTTAPEEPEGSTTVTATVAEESSTIAAPESE